MQPLPASQLLEAQWLLRLPSDVLRSLILSPAVMDPCSRAVCRFVCRRLRDLVPCTSDDCLGTVPSRSRQRAQHSVCSSPSPIFSDAPWLDPMFTRAEKPTRRTVEVLAARQGCLAVLQWCKSVWLQMAAAFAARTASSSSPSSSSCDTFTSTSPSSLFDYPAQEYVNQRWLRPALLHNAAEGGHRHVLLWLIQQVYYFGHP
jgi:hypothetical protein